MSDVDRIQARLRALALRRERLRDLGGSPPALERNRRAIVRANQELSLALISAYAPHAAAA